MEFLQQLLSTDGFHPHGYCYLWRPSLIWLHVISDALIGLAYVGIGFALAYFVRRGRGDLPFSRMFIAFGIFIAACGATHFVEIWTLWTPAYWFSGGVKVVTAAASVFTAMALPPLVPVALNTMASARVSEQRRVELEEAHQRLVELDELKTQFFANVSHELRTPLTLILGPLEQMLGEEHLAPMDRRRLKMVHRNAGLLLRHVNDLLDVARLEAGRVELDYRTVDLAPLVRRTGAHFESIALSRAIDFSLDVPATLSAQVDPEHIEQVLVNLLGNAVKFAPAGSEIRLILEEVTGDGTPLARITVHDAGPGVPRKQRRLIFEPFRQAEGGTARSHGGTGLGLAIVADLVELHGGTVRVEDSYLGGAAFVVELPIRATRGGGFSDSEHQPPQGAGAAAASPGDDAAPPASEARTDLAAFAASKAEAAARAEVLADSQPDLEPQGNPEWPLILVVEDNPEMNSFIAETLADRYRIARAYDGRQGIARALELRPDMIVSDIMMPEVSGETLVGDLRGHPELEWVPILLLSARADEEIRLRLLSQGVQDYLTKPFTPAELRARVANWMEMKRARDVLRRALDTTKGDVEALAIEITTRNAQLEDALAAARLAFDEAEAANRAKTSFLSVMSHELKTPINGVIGYIDLLEAGVGGDLTEVQHGYLARGRKSAEHLVDLVDQVLTYARLEPTSDQWVAEWVDLREVVEAAAAIVEPAASKKKLELEVHLPDGPLRVATDPGKMRQVLVNLVGNAVKFTERGRVRVSVEAEEGWARLQVEDSGRGIEAQDMEKIFEPFWQGDPPLSGWAGGTGLGLAISRRLVDLLGGEIGVSSDPGIGTSFVVWLPMREPDP